MCWQVFFPAFFFPPKSSVFNFWRKLNIDNDKLTLGVSPTLFPSTLSYLIEMPLAQCGLPSPAPSRWIMKTKRCARWKSRQDGGRGGLSSPCACSPASCPSSPVPGGRHPRTVSTREDGSLFKKMPSNQGAVKLPRTGAHCIGGRCTWTSSGRASSRLSLQIHRFLVHAAILPPPSCLGLLAPIPSQFSLTFPKAPGLHFHQQKQPLPSWHFHLKWLFHYTLLRRLKTEF